MLARRAGQVPRVAACIALMLASATSEATEAQANAASLRPPLFALSALLPPGPGGGGDQLDLRSFRNALAHQGIVAVEMGEAFARLRREVMTATARCMDASRGRGVATVGLPGGTTRRTLAGESNTQGDGELRPIFELPGRDSSPTEGEAAAPAPASCLRFERPSAEFRKAAGAVATAFGTRLAEVIEASSDRQRPVPVPEFGTGRRDGSAGGTGSPFAELTHRGPRLEHFHAYERDPGFSVGADPDAAMRLLRTQTLVQTLDFHADQGLFVVFSPGMMVPAAGGPAVGEAAGHFQVRSADGEGNVVVRSLDVSSYGDSVLVILLGDAVRQLGIPRAESLFRVPSHAFRMPDNQRTGDTSLPPQRLWYGMMQLPPPGLLAQNVVDPATRQKLTFGDIRERVAAHAGGDAGSAIGCSPLAQGSEELLGARRLVPRLLEDAAACQNGSIYCWHRCMEIAPVGLSDEECEARGSGWRITCTSQFDQVYRPQDGHGDYNPACSNATDFVTQRPAVEQPIGGEAADAAAWASLTTPGAGANAAFDHMIALDQQTGSTVLLWRALNKTLDDQGAAYLHAKMIHRGLVGWMAVGLESIGGRHNGMNGGPIVMAGRSQAGDGPPLFVGEYRIHPRASAFRHWQTPLATAEPGNASLEIARLSTENGVSIMEFKTQRIYKQPLNLSTPVAGSATADSDGYPSTGPHAVNRLIWGITHSEYCTEGYGGYCAYHIGDKGDRRRRDEFRGKVALDLSSGVQIAVGPIAEHEPATTAEPEVMSGATGRRLCVLIAACVVLLALR